MVAEPVVTVVVSGPGHHDRAEAAADLIGRLAELGRVGVVAELRPRLAADVEALLDAGAEAVRLSGERIAGEFGSGSGRELGDVDIVVELVAAAQPITAAVEPDSLTESSRLAEAVERVVASWNQTREEGDPR